VAAFNSSQHPFGKDCDGSGVMTRNFGECVAVSDGKDLYITLNGMRIAKRGKPGTRHARTWILLEPGWTIRDVGYPPKEILIQHKHVSAH
jgi:hypothetical protein